MSIITRTDDKCQTENWKKLLAEGFRSPRELLTYLDLHDYLEEDFLAEHLFPMRVPKPYADRMEKGNIQDPLLQQVLPSAQEFISISDYSNDPLAEKQQGQHALLHKYQSRVLLILASACAINCRYCFRRHFPYQDNRASDSNLAAALSYIRQRPEVNEVIFSGGDPLMVSDKRLSSLVEQLKQVPQITRIRIHSRIPLVLPQRVNESMLSWCASDAKHKLILVNHINHAQEIDDVVSEAFARLRANGVVLLNQSVLLRGINDDPDVLAALSEKLFASDVLPYYLHALDKTAGTSHFDLEEARAKYIYAELWARLPGFLVPKFVREIPGENSKTPITAFSV